MWGGTEWSSSRWEVLSRIGVLKHPGSMHSHYLERPEGPGNGLKFLPTLPPLRTPTWILAQDTFPHSTGFSSARRSSSIDWNRNHSRNRDRTLGSNCLPRRACMARHGLKQRQVCSPLSHRPGLRHTPGDGRDFPRPTTRHKHALGHLSGPPFALSSGPQRGTCIPWQSAGFLAED